MIEKNTFRDVDHLRPAPPADPAARPASARPRPPSRRGRAALTAAVAVVLAVALGVATFVYGRMGEGSVGGRPTFAPGTGDYAQVYDAVTAVWLRAYHESGRDGSVDPTRACTTRSDPPDISAKVQVQGGDDEGDVVKTDGRTIFVASGTRVTLVAASGARTATLGAFDITVAHPAGPPGRGADNVFGDIIDLMLTEDRLVVLVDDYAPRPGRHRSGDGDDVELVAERTMALVYDVADPADPVFVTSLGQSGAHTASRLKDGVLHLVSDHAISLDAEPDPDRPETFAPVVSDGTAVEPLPPADITLAPSPNSPRYAVASAIDVAAGARLAHKAVLGGAATAYLSADNLYLATPSWFGEVAVPDAPLAAVGLADTTGLGCATHVARLSLPGLTVAAQTTLPGLPLAEFPFDERDGDLRAVLTVLRHHDGPWTRRASLVVLDADLDVVGSVASLVDDETVESARFLATAVTIVAWPDLRFSADLSDPARPVVRSPLAIPGPSAHLHPWSDGLLLGAGLTDQAHGWPTGLELSLLDTSDPSSVRQVATLKVPVDGSKAMYDHKATLVDSEHGIVGLPATYSDDPVQHYLVYRHDAGQFHLAQDLTVDQGDDPGEDSKDSPVRGLLVADDLYVASQDAVSVYTLGGAPLATVRL